ncbi:phage tail tape measure protein, partial [Paenibacillus larvae]
MAMGVGGVMDGGEVRARMTLDLKDYANKIKRVHKEMEDTKKKSKKAKESIEKMGKGAAVAGAAMVGGFAAVVKQAADFEQQMSKVKAISGATGEDFQRLNETARHLGATTKFTATQAGEGMEYLALAGWKTNDIISAMPGMLDLAAAGALDLGRAADIVSDTMQAFGLDASTATHAADVFAYAQANANTNVEQMGEAMKYLSPIAHALGWSLEESSAATMSLANSGLKGSIAGQAFASSLARLAKPTKRMAGLMKKTGMEFFDAQGKMKSMPELVAEIEKGTKGMTEQQRSAALSILFGAEAYKHWAILLDTGSGKLKD